MREKTNSPSLARRQNQRRGKKQIPISSSNCAGTITLQDET
jgi:hypothetical protein